jgi:hypothetical protein
MVFRCQFTVLLSIAYISSSVYRHTQLHNTTSLSNMILLLFQALIRPRFKNLYEYFQLQAGVRSHPVQKLPLIK